MIAKQKLWHHRVGLVKTRPMMCFLFNPRPCAAFYSVESVRGGGSVGHPPQAVRPLMDLELCGKKRACCAQRGEADGTQF